MANNFYFFFFLKMPVTFQIALPPEPYPYVINRNKQKQGRYDRSLFSSFRFGVQAPSTCDMFNNNKKRSVGYKGEA